VASSCEHGNEPSGSIMSGELSDHLRDYQLLKKDSAPWNYLKSFNVLIQYLHGAESFLRICYLICVSLPITLKT